EFADPNGTGDVHQTTTTGLAFWRKSTNTPTFTNGWEHWAHSSRGWLCWTGQSIDPTGDAQLCIAGANLTLLALVTVAEVPADLPPYDRRQWRAWVDADHDCQDTRAEVLIAESRIPVTFQGTRQCVVVSGLWTNIYTGRDVTNAMALDIDHVVPLANAYRSGAWSWDAAR